MTEQDQPTNPAEARSIERHRLIRIMATAAAIAFAGIFLTGFLLASELGARLPIAVAIVLYAVLQTAAAVALLVAWDAWSALTGSRRKPLIDPGLPEPEPAAGDVGIRIEARPFMANAQSDPARTQPETPEPPEPISDDSEGQAEHDLATAELLRTIVGEHAGHKPPTA